MDIPLTIWYCDVCSGSFKRDDGYVIWRVREKMRANGFKIIHQGKCDDGSHESSLPLSDFLGNRGREMLLSHLSIGRVKRMLGDSADIVPADMDEFVDFFRRVQTPYYEEARRCFGDQEFEDDFHDANELYPYLEEQLKTIISRYGK